MKISGGLISTYDILWPSLTHGHIATPSPRQEDAFIALETACGEGKEEPGSLQALPTV